LVLNPYHLREKLQAGKTDPAAKRGLSCFEHL
jgi:hypothetical protein